MSKKPASLTSDLLARKGEAGPSSVDPISRVTLSPGRQPSLSGIGADEGPSPALYASAATERPDMYGSDEEERPSPPEPEIIYTPEDEEGGGRGRLIAGAFVGVALLAGVLVAFSLNDSGTGIAPVSPELTAQPEAASEPVPGPAAEAPAEVPAIEEPAEETAAAPVSEPAEEAFADLREETAPAAPTEPAQEAAPAAAADNAPASIVPPAAPAPEPATTAAVAESTPPAAAPASGGAFVVQIMALREEAAARSAWDALQAKHGAILGGHALDIERADLGEKGVFYRVRAAGFDTKAAAQSACTSLKSAGQDCMVKAR